MNKYSCRVVITAGGTLSAVGFAASAFAKSVDFVILTVGVIVGKFEFSLRMYNS